MTTSIATRHDHATLTVTGPDQPGLNAAVTALIAEHGGNVVSLDQHTTNPEGGNSSNASSSTGRD